MTPTCRSLVASAALVSTWGCVGATPPLETKHVPAELACSASAAVPNALVGPGAILLFGEIHGVREFPAFFGEAVCLVAATGAHVTAALELPASEQVAVDRFLASEDEASAMRGLTASPFWTREHQDGRSSEAMAALLARLRELRAAGLRIDAFLFDVDTPGPDRDARMAERLAAYVRSRPNGLLMALTGNLHARTAPGAPWDPSWRPMGWFLRDAGVRVASLDAAGPRGTAWICQSDAASSCGARDVRTGKTAARTSAGIELAPETSPEGFAGVYVTSTITASEPAVRLAR